MNVFIGVCVCVSVRVSSVCVTQKEKKEGKSTRGEN